MFLFIIMPSVSDQREHVLHHIFSEFGYTEHADTDKLYYINYNVV